MKIFFLCAGAISALLAAGCVKDVPVRKVGNEPEKVVDLVVPASFDWKTTTSVACDFTPAYLSRVYVATTRDAEPFATFMVGGDADPVRLDLPAGTRKIYVSYETPTGGRSTPQAVPVNNSRAVHAIGADSRNWGLEDGDKNTTRGNVIHMPADGWGTLLFEDLWPACGDYDFNDFVIYYKAQLYMNSSNTVSHMLLGVSVRATGGSLPYEFRLKLNGVPAKEILEIEVGETHLADDARLVVLNAAQGGDPAVLGFEHILGNPNRQPGAAFLNTEQGYELSEEQMVSATFAVVFENEIPIRDVAFDSFDFFITRERKDGRRIEIHCGGYEPSAEAVTDYVTLKAESSNTDRTEKYYYSNDGLVWALNIPHAIQHVYEKVDFLKAYPRMATWAQSGGAQAQDWYLKGEKKYLVQANSTGKK